MKSLTFRLRLFHLLLIATAGVATARAAEGGLDEVSLRVQTTVAGGGPRVRPPVGILGATFRPWYATLDAFVGPRPVPAGSSAIAEFLQPVDGELIPGKSLHGTLTRVEVCLGGSPAHVAAVAYDDDGVGGAPGSLLAIGEPTLIPGPGGGFHCSFITLPAVDLGVAGELTGRLFVGARIDARRDPEFYVGADTWVQTPVQDAYTRTGPVETAPFELVRNSFPQVRALGIGAWFVSASLATRACIDTANVVCLKDDRFRVEIDWRKPNQEVGRGTDSGLRTSDSDVQWFFNAANLEILIKVLDACVVNDRYWVFYAATTNVEFTMTVIDTETGKVKTYFNPLGRPAPPVQDTNAFSCIEGARYPSEE